jgi:xylulokinase
LPTNKKIIAYDLGTGGNKASLYDAQGRCLAKTFVPYDTLYPASGWHEQRPVDWWNAVITSTRQLLNERKKDAGNIECISISGHSLGVVPVDSKGTLLRETTPIWSDTRAGKQMIDLFKRVEQNKWYMTTGNGFPPACYSVFKIMWYRENEPGMFSDIYKILGTKDFINYKLTGKMLTDYSYASGSGVYDLQGWDYSDTLVRASGLPREIFPDIVPSTHVVGALSSDTADALGLVKGTKVVCGGVDNSCMALGARNIEDGRVYTSLGSSSWIAVSSRKPVLDAENRPFVFTHVIPEMFTSAVSIFSAGNSLNWVRDNLVSNLKHEASSSGRDVYEIMNELASESPVGSNKLLFNPSLAGGSSQEQSPNIRGAYAGIDLGHTQGDIIRACMEGVAVNLGQVLDLLKSYTTLSNEMVLVGGGSKSKLWRQIFADVFDMDIVITNIGQEAGSLGAAAVGAVGCELWKNFKKIDDAHEIRETVKPDPENCERYGKLRPAYEHVRRSQADLGDILHDIEL